MDKLIVADYGFKTKENFGTIALVENKNGEIALFDRESQKRLTPLIKGRCQYNKEIIMIIGDNQKGYFYDIQSKSFYASDVDILYVNRFAVAAYYDPKTKLYYVASFQEKQIKSFKKLDIKSSTIDDDILIISDGKGVGLYWGEKCYIPIGTAKDIDSNGIVTTLEGEQYYVRRGGASKKYERVTYYPGKGGTYICYKNGVAFCFKTWGYEFTYKCEEMILDDMDNFIVKRDGKYGVLTISDDFCEKNRKKLLIPIEYDKIVAESSGNFGGVYYLYKGEKVLIKMNGKFSKKH